MIIPVACVCMIKQQEDGSEMCLKCHGDFYACDCPLTHGITCPDHPSNQNWLDISRSSIGEG